MIVQPRAHCRSHSGVLSRFLAQSVMLVWLLGTARLCLASPEQARPDAAVEHPIPAPKHLPGHWLADLAQRGQPQVWRGDDLTWIGMPVGGIGAGQLLLCGDGRLGCWEIFNRYTFRGTGRDSYLMLRPEHPVDSGLAVILYPRAGEKPTRAVPLSAVGFADVAFRGEYPIGTVHYSDPQYPVRVTLEAFSPFIPLNAADSALPATILRVTVANTSDAAVVCSVLGRLENAVCHESLRRWPNLPGRRRTRVTALPRGTLLLHDALEPPPAAKVTVRPPKVLQDFERPDYGDWKVEGAAFGPGPSHGTEPTQQPVSGFLGRGLVNTYRGGRGGDALTGTLTSPPFVIDRPYINFLIGGGAHAGKTCIQLLVDGKVVRSSAGKNRERLEWSGWDVREFIGRTASIRIVDRATGGWGHINVDHIVLADAPPRFPVGPVAGLPDAGTLGLALTQAAAGFAESARAFALLESVRVRRLAHPGTVQPFPERLQGVIMTRPETIPAGEHRTATFVLVWHFPNAPHGQWYASRFKAAVDVANYVLANLDRLVSTTRLWRDTWYDSTLPWWLLDRLHAPVSTLATGTCQWWKNGRFWAYEGVACCPGTCTHVWNYAQAHAFLFPEIARRIREMQDFAPVEQGGGFHPETGLVGFRGNHAYAADGQCGAVLKAFREHLLSPDDRFLRRTWPAVRKAVEFLIRHDGNDDGIIEDRQHNTYDVEFYGPNPFVGFLYLAALKAAEQMADAVADSAFAARCRRLYDAGRKNMVERLWNGEYFVQIIDPKHPARQFGRGCLSDQLLGLFWADRLGLGPLVDDTYVQSTLSAIWKYNWAPDVWMYNRVHRPGRMFAAPGEPGLITCTWPRSAYPSNAVPYKNEVWTGTEYEAAATMIAHGLVREGLAVCRGVHARYSAARRNPWNEVECGDHYARALASWGVFLALCGFECNGPAGRLRFAPRITPNHFKAAFTAPEGWGAFEQRVENGVQTIALSVRCGQVRLRSLGLESSLGGAPDAVTALLGKNSIPCKVLSGSGPALEVLFERPVTVETGKTLAVRLGRRKP